MGPDLTSDSEPSLPEQSILPRGLDFGPGEDGRGCQGNVLASSIGTRPHLPLTFSNSASAGQEEHQSQGVPLG